MLTLATITLGVALILGGGAAIPRLGRNERPPPWWLATAHGGVALGGLALLLVVLPGAQRGAAAGAQSFGLIAAILLGAAAFLGLTMLALHWRKRRITGLLVGVHATLAVAGFVILGVFALLG